MKKTVLFLILILVLMTVLPIAAHDGDEELVAGALSTSRNITLLGVLGILSLLTIGVVYHVSAIRSWKLWRWGVVGLTALSALIHLDFGLHGDLLLLLNGLGYIGLLALLVAPIAFLAPYQQWVRGLLLIYTTVTFIGYFALHTPAAYSNTVLLTKAVELILMVCIGIRIWHVRTNGRLPTEKINGALTKDSRTNSF